MRDRWTVYSNMVAVTPSDTADLPNLSYDLFATGAGNISVDVLGGPTALVLPVLANSRLAFPTIVKRVRATGTTATGIFNLF